MNGAKWTPEVKKLVFGHSDTSSDVVFIR